MTSRTLTARTRRLLGGGSLAGLIGLCALIGGASGATTVTTFDYTGAEEAYVVPGGVTSLHVVAVGAEGGSSFGPGGSGARVTADIPVTPGETLYVAVGGDGSAAAARTFNGGGGASGGTSRSGGGATDIRRCSRTAASCPGGGTSLESRVVVAGGGGGAADARGGDSGEVGADGANSCCGMGGKGGTATAGGAGGSGSSNNGQDGTIGEGGNGGYAGQDSAGGGGGGYYGGGGGGGTGGGGGGGGGGSSYVDPDATSRSFATDTGGTASLTITPASARPDATTQPASDLGTTGATLNGAVNPGGHATTYHFEYGKTTAYDAVTADASAGSGGSNVSVASTLSGLETETTYHFRLVAENANGVAVGEDRSFSTDAEPALPQNGDDAPPESGAGGSTGGGSTGGVPTPSTPAATSRVDNDPPELSAAVPHAITRRQLVYGFRVRGGCDEACSIRFEALAPQGSGLRQAGFNYVLARAALASGDGNRGVTIRPCVRGSTSAARTRECRRSLLSALSRRRPVRILVRSVATDKAGNRTRQRQTVEVK